MNIPLLIHTQFLPSREIWPRDDVSFVIKIDAFIFIEIDMKSGAIADADGRGEGGNSY